ncbi:Ketocytochalasin monooxygenase [Cyphellophora attinorum]|uniref:Ketocytochalasin monooxygenase n=1 Tax=Cyphellophora attinorum TaxID=1664694 RepID=A0A0N1P446_9EURO|nr:Ketocytochalasin monooxygenase [Phialophora attinorum]KPI45180.1 Ketocytochalasin monooxygenase [Phialophora attinorum]
MDASTVNVDARAAAADVKKKYEQERQKRQQTSKGLAQFSDRQQSKELLLQDPWVESGTDVHRPVKNGGTSKIVVFGAGFGGLLAAIQCLESGAAKTPGDILMVDPAGGFGGTWYWNRYPGLMCDVESYVYLPLLEETGYMPTRRYAGGEEIRKYCNTLAKHWGLTDRALFQSSGKTLTWENDHWVCEIAIQPKGLPEETIRINTSYVIIGSGAFTYPKIPNVPGLKTFEGQSLHTARWDYSITGGSPASPVLDNLKDKRVAIVGTGATAIQVVPELAKYAKELYVVQRTASAVGIRDNRDTDAEEWKTKIASKKGWHAERMKNLQIFTEQSVDLPEENLINDGFCSMPSISGAFGGPSDLKPEDMAKQIEYLYKLDDERAQKVRDRALEIVKDRETAEKLQAWYPGWCKRPTFHDEYLPTFNQPNVHLVDTDGQGIDSMGPHSITVAGKEYPIDVLVWSTGYGNPLLESLAGKADIIVRGTNGKDMEELNKAMDLKTLHGLISYGFPNLFTPSLAQAGVGAEKQVGKEHKTIITVEEKACDKWQDELQANAHLTGAIVQCLPGYFTLEGDVAHLPPEALGKMSRGGLYGQGYLKYAKILDEWRAKGDLEGLNVASAA